MLAQITVAITNIAGADNMILIWEGKNQGIGYIGNISEIGWSFGG